jgi:hypothetical protein
MRDKLRDKIYFNSLGEAICICTLLGMFCYQTYRVAIMDNHIEHLEVHIQENGLTIPTMRIK